jgi:tryptophanyl-tRNA synthetase
MSKPLFFTGIQTSGTLTLGNYLGVIRHILQIQERCDEVIIMIADLHALTIPKREFNYHQKCYEMAALLYACGLKKEKCKIFIQSEIKEHSELAWLLAPFVTVSELSNMIQYKEKKKENETGSLALLSYPVLQAADIFLYDVNYIIVGQDQKQHLELASDIARKFNVFCRDDLLKVPNFEILPGGKIMSLKDPTKKMSKSEKNFISLLDSDEDIKRKVLDAVTDSYNWIRFDPKSQPGISNLLTIYALLKNQKVEELAEEIGSKIGYNYFGLKFEVLNLIQKEIRPIRERYTRQLPNEIKELLEKNSEELRERAKNKITMIKKKLNIQ